MKPHGILTTVVLMVVIFLSGCSQGTSPVDTGLDESSDTVQVSCDNSHGLMGLWTFICNPGAGSVEIIPLRNTDLHLNAVAFLEPPPLLYITLESNPTINGSILDVDIGIRNPFVGQYIYTGFDVCGIIFTHGSETGFSDPEIVMAGEGDTRLLNADGYTRWWNPAEFPHGNTIFNYKDGILGNPAGEADLNCTINGYKYFADGLGPDDPLTNLDPAKRGIFTAGKKNIRHYTIDLSGGLIFNYAVDACWKMPQGSPPYIPPDDFPEGANRGEAWNIVITELENSLYHADPGSSAGGKLRLQLKIWDHFNAGVNIVCGESLAGLPLTTSPGPIGGGVGYSTYELDFSGDSLIESGDAELLIEVRSEESGYGGILPGKLISSYYKYVFNISQVSPTGWALTWGDLNEEIGWSVAVDEMGCVYVTGHFGGDHGLTIDFDPGPGVDERTSNGGEDAFLIKFASDGSYLWVNTWGGATGQDRVLGIAVDKSGAIYVVGRFGETVDFDPGPGVEERTATWSYDVFLSKFHSDGQFEWVRTWDADFFGGGSHYEPGNPIVVDEYGDIYVTGYFYGTVDFDPGPGIDEHTSNGDTDAFLSKFKTNGDFYGALTWGGESHEFSVDIATDGFSTICVIGTYRETVDFDPGPGVEDHTIDSGTDVYLSKFDLSGNFKWVRTWGGNGHEWVPDDSGTGVAVDSAGNVFATGYYTDTTDFDPGPGIDEHAPVGIMDIYLSKFDKDGDFQWARTWGGVSYDYSHEMAVDIFGAAYVVGVYRSPVDFDPGPGIDIQDAGGHWCSYLTKFDTDGNYLYVRTLGQLDTRGHGVATDPFGCVYTCGHFSGDVDFMPGTGVDYHASMNNTIDVFLVKYSPDGNW